MGKTYYKGDGAGYSAKHSFINSHFGKANHCEVDPTHKGRFVWANLNGKYSRRIVDYAQLCYSCHRLYDCGKISVRGRTLADRGGKPINYNPTWLKSLTIESKIKHKLGTSRALKRRWNNTTNDERVEHMRPALEAYKKLHPKRQPIPNIPKDELLKIQQLSGHINGTKRFSSMTPEERSEFSRRSARIRWDKIKIKEEKLNVARIRD